MLHITYSRNVQYVIFSFRIFSLKFPPSFYTAIRSSYPIAEALLVVGLVLLRPAFVLGICGRSGSLLSIDTGGRIDSIATPCPAQTTGTSTPLSLR